MNSSQITQSRFSGMDGTNIHHNKKPKTAEYTLTILVIVSDIVHDHLLPAQT